MMIKLTDGNFESLFKDFIVVRDEWMSLVRALSIYSDENSSGESVRHIAMTTSKSNIKRAGEILLKWQQFHDIAESKREAGIHACNKALYYPIPVIRSEFTKCSINEFSATSVFKIRKEDLLIKLQKRVDKARRSKKPLGVLYNVPEIERDIEEYSKFPAGTMFRVRVSGYNDIFIDLFMDKMETKRERIGQYGILLDSTKAERANKNKETPFWGVNNGRTGQYESVYKRLIPMRCSLYSNCELYLLDAVEREKELTKKENKIATQRRYTERRRAGLPSPRTAIKITARN